MPRYLSIDQPAVRFSLTWIDMILFNLFFYFLLHALVLYPLGFTSIFQIFLWCAFLVCWMYFHQRLRLWGGRFRLWQPLVQIGLFLLFAVVVTAISNVETPEKGNDWSWLRPEMIKFPWWLRMFIPLCPLYTGCFIALVSSLIWLAILAPKHWALRILPMGATLVLIWKISSAFAPFGGVSLDPNFEGPREDLLLANLIMFAGPSVVFSILMWIRWYTMAFRAVPLMFHMSLIILNYIGILPVHSIYDVLPIATERGLETKNVPGVSVLYSPPGTDVDASFLFLRKLVLTNDKIFVNYGPTCGMYGIDRRNHGARKVSVPGLMRDICESPDKERIWGLNWMRGDFLVFDKDTLAITCSQDLFKVGMTTPYNMLVDGDRMFMSNVTYPIVAEFVWQDKDNPCTLRMVRSLDFFRTGFTKFTDAAFGMHLDRNRNRLYVIVALIEGRYLGAMVEIDLETFQMTRSIKLTTGNPIFPIHGRDHVLIPSYYTSEIHEVSLITMEEVRTLRSEPNVVSMEHDERRGLFYGLCRAPGLLVVIDDQSGKTIKKVPVGAKPEPIWLDRASDQLFVGSGLGILQIDLKVFLGES